MHIAYRAYLPALWANATTDSNTSDIIQGPRGINCDKKPAMKDSSSAIFPVNPHQVSFSPFGRQTKSPPLRVCLVRKDVPNQWNRARVFCFSGKTADGIFFGFHPWWPFSSIYASDCIPDNQARTFLCPAKRPRAQRLNVRIIIMARDSATYAVGRRKASCR